jgi:hypothetical protein
MNTNLATLIPQFFDSSGNPLSGGMLNTYSAGTTSSLVTYPTNADAVAGTNANSTAISINASGYPASGGNVIGVFLRPGKQYKFILTDSSGATVYSVDNISNLTDTLVDGNGNEVIKLAAVASAVNEITVTNAATGNSPSISASGDDTNVGLTVKSKNTGTLTLQGGAITLQDNSSLELAKLTGVASAVNEITLTNAITTASPSVSATGDDTNIDITVKGKGTGKNIVGTATSTGMQLAGDQPILDSAGNEYLKFVKTTTAVNELTVTNAATATNPSLSATGGDTNVGIDLQSKGTGTYNLKGTATQEARLRLGEQTTNGTNIVEIRAPASITADRTVTLPDTDLSCFVVQRVGTSVQAVTASSTNIPYDDTIPQSTEGVEVMTQAITPKSANNVLVIDVTVFSSGASISQGTCALFKDSGANAVAASACASSTSDAAVTHKIRYAVVAGSTAATTYRVRVGQSTGNVTFNGSSSARIFGGVAASSIIITEYTQ